MYMHDHPIFTVFISILSSSLFITFTFGIFVDLMCLQIYEKNADRYNVRIGKKYGDTEFFLINTLNGAPTVPGYNVKNGDCYASVENSTEG